MNPWPVSAQMYLSSQDSFFPLFKLAWSLGAHLFLHHPEMLLLGKWYPERGSSFSKALVGEQGGKKTDSGFLRVKDIYYLLKGEIVAERGRGDLWSPVHMFSYETNLSLKIQIQLNKCLRSLVLMPAASFIFFMFFHVFTIFYLCHFCYFSQFCLPYFF